jgi:hypothetical protein
VNANYLVSLYSPPSQELRLILDDYVTAPNSISVETPETASTLTCSQKLFFLDELIDANQKEHHQIAYERTPGSNTGK